MAAVPTLVTAPSGLPVTIAEARAWMRVEYSEEDSVIQTMLEAATSHMDGRDGALGICILLQTWQVTQAEWTDEIELPFHRNISTVVVKYRDEEDAEQTVSSTLYEVVTDSTGAFVRFKKGFTSPTLNDDGTDAVQVRVTAGWADASAVPARIKTAIMALAANWFEDREAIGAMPPGVMHMIAPLRRMYL